jgi:hypothetical protein
VHLARREIDVDTSNPRVGPERRLDLAGAILAAEAVEGDGQRRRCLGCSGVLSRLLAVGVVVRR